MTAAHLHLLINHFPIVGNAISVLLFLWAFIRKKTDLMQLALGFSILIALFGFAADYTGDGAADQVKDMPGISQQDIKAHAQSADVTIDLIYVTSAMALLALILFVKEKKASKIFIYLTFALTLITSYAVFRTGYLGGLIRHPEISVTTTK